MPDETIEVVLEKTADFFSEISNSSEPVREDLIKTTYDRPVYELTPDMVYKRVSESKKPSSMVPGDVPPALVMKVMKVLSGPICNIFNDVPKYNVWPSAWKKEYQTIVPKKPSPTSLSE